VVAAAAEEAVAAWAVVVGVALGSRLIPTTAATNVEREDTTPTIVPGGVAGDGRDVAGAAGRFSHVAPDNQTNAHSGKIT